MARTRVYHVYCLQPPSEAMRQVLTRDFSLTAPENIQSPLVSLPTHRAAQRLQQALDRRGIASQITAERLEPPGLAHSWLLGLNLSLAVVLVGLLGWLLLPSLWQTRAVQGANSIMSVGTRGFATSPRPLPLSGALAPYPPQQQQLSGTEAWQHQVGKQHYQLQAQARFRVRGRLLSKQRYRFDRMAALAPWDVVVGWGAMSDNRWLRYVRIQQARRWYHWHALPAASEVGLDSNIALSSANIHIIPATEAIRQRLADVRPQQLLLLEGLLVDVQDAAGYQWRSSLSRDDEGAGACEILWLTELRLLPEQLFHHTLEATETRQGLE